MLTRSVIMLALLLLTATGTWAADPGDEAANRESCSGTCDTCPGKAQALLGLAGSAKVLLAVDGISGAEHAKRVRAAISGLKGVESCVVFAEQGWVWAAYDNDLASIAQLSKGLAGLGVTVTGELQRIAPLAELAEGQERAAIYVLLPQADAKRQAALDKSSTLPGVVRLSYDRAYNLLLVDLDPAKTSAAKLKQALVKAGYAAGLPGEEMTQP